LSNTTTRGLPDNQQYGQVLRQIFMGTALFLIPKCRFMTKINLIVVCGAGGFIGGHLVGWLRAQGHATIRVVDVKPLPEWYDLTAPKGVRGRNSDNTMIKKRLNWEPGTTLTAGLEKTYAWIYEQMAPRYRR
jgi:nucleoside-diphosphate-sugar epimerase